MAPQEPATRGTGALVILNPMAGQSDPATVRQALETALGDQGWAITVYETTGDDDLAAHVETARAGGCALVIAAGGDGTVAAVADTLVGTGVPLAILPVGTANVLALTLGIPRDLARAAALIAGPHRTLALDAMRIGDRHFLLQIGVGLDALMIKDTDRAWKRRFGRLAYLATLVNHAFGYQSRRFTLIVDGRRLRPRAFEVLLANAGTLGLPGLTWGPHIDPADGRLDLCVVTLRNPLDSVKSVWHILRGRHEHARSLRFFTVSEAVTIVADEPLPIQADGEIVGETPIQVTVVPRAVAVVVPENTP